jgi:hypothetical protein
MRPTLVIVLAKMRRLRMTASAAGNSVAARSSRAESGGALTLVGGLPKPPLIGRTFHLCGREPVFEMLDIGGYLKSVAWAADVSPASSS